MYCTVPCCVQMPLIQSYPDEKRLTTINSNNTVRYCPLKLYSIITVTVTISICIIIPGISLVLILIGEVSRGRTGFG